MSGTDGFGGEGAYIRLVASGGALSGYVSVPGTAAADTSVGALKAVLCAEGGPANASILRGVAVEPESVRVCVLGRELHDDDETLGSATRRIAASTPLGVLDQDTIDAALGGPTGLFDVVVLAPLMAGVGARADEGFVVAASGHAARVPPIEALFPIAFAPPPPEPEPEPPNKFAVMNMPVDEERLTMLTAMGFPEFRARKALLLHIMDVEAAMEWILANIDSPTLDEEFSREELAEMVTRFEQVRRRHEEGGGDAAAAAAAAPAPAPAGSGGGGTDVYNPEIGRAVQNSMCTYAVTGPSFAIQKWYMCVDCGLTVNTGLCESCAAVCHAGHNLSEVRVSAFYCDCGAGEGVLPCSCLQN